MTPIDFLDLTRITTPWALLGDETKRRMKSHKGDFEYFSSSSNWTKVSGCPSWYGSTVYRAVPVPDKPTVFWRNEYSSCVGNWYDSREDCGYNRRGQDCIFVTRKEVFNGIATYWLEKPVND